MMNTISVLSIRNFTYVRRPLGVNNAAYEILRKGNPAVAVEPEKATAKPVLAKTSAAAAGGNSTGNKGS